MNHPELQAALEAVEAGDPEALAPLLWTHHDLVNATLAHDGRSTKPRPTLLHRANCRSFATTEPNWHEGHLEVAQLLIDMGADIDRSVDGCMPPLEMAAWSRNPEMVELLARNGADTELYCEEKPAEIAVLYDRRDMFKPLIEAGAQYDISHTLRLGMMRESKALLESDASLANTETDHGLPLNLAVNTPGLFRLLLRYGADIHAVDTFGLTPLKAARIPQSDAVVQTLLEMGVEDDLYGAIVAGDENKVEAFLKADPSQAHAVSCWPGRGPLPPVIWAVWSGSIHILELILQQGVALDFVPSPLTTAVLYRYDEMVQLLLDHGASPECEYPYGWPGSLPYPSYRPLSPNEIPRAQLPLYNALRSGTTAAVEMLLDAGANPSCTRSGWSGLQWPARGGNLQQVKRLVERGADLQSPCAQSGLRLAVNQCKPAMVEWLVSHGTDIDVVDEEGRGLVDLVGKSDSRPGPAQRDRTRLLLDELFDICHSPPKVRGPQLRDRAELLDAVIDGDLSRLDPVWSRAPGLFYRELVQHELLHYAASCGHDEIVIWLVAHGAPQTISAATALGWIDHVTIILDDNPHQLEGTLPFEETDKKKHLPWFEHTPLTIAAMYDRVDIVALLLDRGAELDRPVGWYENTALHHAVRRHSTETVRLLLERGADVTIRSRDHHLPTALVMNNPPTVSRRPIRDLLIAHGANPKEQLPHWVVE